MKLNILLVEDEPADMKAYIRDFPSEFAAAGIQATLHPAKTFQEAYELIDSSHIRYDLILSDTYRGEQKDRDAAVIAMVNKYRGGRFCPLIVFSASARPDGLEVGAFVIWADKSVNGDIEAAIRKMLSTGIPQLARSLHDELDKMGGGFLWTFLEANWEKLWHGKPPDTNVLERLVRRRAALKFSEAADSGGTPVPVSSIAGLEYYMYPPLHKQGFRLGQIISKSDEPSDIRVVLTPHCHLTIQEGNSQPRAEYVLTVKAINALQVLGTEKITNAKALDELKQNKKLKTWSTPPSGDTVGKPEGRYWYLPSFLDIPHSYCDFQQLETLGYAAFAANYKPIAVLTPPFAESLQACFVGYHAGVGIPNIRPESIRSLLH
jgi:CheY-like chemotaxis protein